MTAVCKSDQIYLEVPGKRRNRYLCTVPVAHSIEEVLSPDYFGRVMASNLLTVGDIIEVEWEDYSRFGELQVMAQARATNQCVTRERLPLTDYTPQAFPKGWSSKWLGGAEHHALFKDGLPMSKETGFPTIEAASIRAHAIASTLATADATRSAVKAATAKKTMPRPAETEPQEAGAE